MRENGQWEKALALLDKMDSRGIKPEVISYSVAMSACEKGGKREEARERLREMENQGVTQDVISSNAAISACEKPGWWC
jgi:pentatricopeptide repeat domain-containing protein 1